MIHLLRNLFKVMIHAMKQLAWEGVLRLENVSSYTENVMGCLIAQMVMTKWLVSYLLNAQTKTFHPKSIVSRNVQYKDVHTRTMEIPQRALILKGNHCLKVHNAHFKLVSPICGLDVKPNGATKLQDESQSVGPGSDTKYDYLAKFPPRTA